MKKLFITICMIVALMVVPFTAMADSDSDTSGGGVFNATAYDANSAIDYYGGQNTGAFGAAGGVGFGTSAGFGGIYGNGTVWGDATANGGGISGLYVGPSVGGVSSGSFAGAETGATLDVGTDIVDGFGIGTSDGFIGGSAAQGTLNGTFVTESQGFSAGVAGQSSTGEFVGGAVTFAMGSDTVGTVGVGSYSGGTAGGPGWYIHDKNPGRPQSDKIQYFENGHPTGNSEWTWLGATQVTAGGNDVFATADAGAGITMLGGSYSTSYRDTSTPGTESMGTNVGSFTTVNSFGYANDSSGGGGIAGANVVGGWTAKGGVSTLTVQTTNNGGASAFATGSYSGSGNLGTNFVGSAVGYTQTSITTFPGMNGSINSSSAGMSVSVGSY